MALDRTMSASDVCLKAVPENLISTSPRVSSTTTQVIKIIETSKVLG
jgi:hypothetical protein